MTAAVSIFVSVLAERIALSLSPAERQRIGEPYSRVSARGSNNREENDMGNLGTDPVIVILATTASLLALGCWGSAFSSAAKKSAPGEFIQDSADTGMRLFGALVFTVVAFALWSVLLF
ncbi:MAG: hypothetical protein ACREQ4_06210 [Candidatus Binataceae bacterium]